jgi:hypothetical protein
MATHSKTRTAVQRLRRAARRLRARELQRARQAEIWVLRRGLAFFPRRVRESAVRVMHLQAEQISETMW